MIGSFSGSYRFLSNFYSSEIVYGGVIFPTVEHAYQATKFPIGSETWERIWRAESPKKAKKLGQSPGMRSDWEDVKIGIMRDLLRLKFQDGFLANELLKTMNDPLAEGNWWGDRFWGVYKGEGQNWLGKLLMEIREELRVNKCM